MKREITHSFRQAEHDDYEFLYQLHEAAMRPYIEVLWGWEDSWQQEYFARKFDPSKRQVIQIEDQDAGVLVLEDRRHDLYICLIEILPRYQGRGVGSTIIINLLDRARKQSKFLTLHVLKSNKPARRLYERLGLVVIGEEEYHFKMASKMPEEKESGK